MPYAIPRHNKQINPIITAPPSVCKQCTNVAIANDHAAKDIPPSHGSACPNTVHIKVNNPAATTPNTIKSNNISLTASVTLFFLPLTNSNSLIKHLSTNINTLIEI